MRFIVILMLVISTAGFGQKKKKGKEEPAQQPAPTQQTPQQQQTAPQQQTQAQPADTVPPPNASEILTEHYLRKYNAAARWNDMEIAKSALYDVIIENPGIDSLIYTLAYYYYEDQKYASSLLIAQDLLGRDPKNAVYLEMAGTSAQQLGANEKALQHYESLYLINNNIRTLYQIAFLQYQVKRYAECATSINIMLGKPEVTTEKAVFEDAKGNQKEYPLKVSVLNLKGLLALDQNDKAGAKKAFTEALAISPDFMLAKANLEKTK
jgi:tetratricopeptide (TPR) repeat protein